MKDLQHNLNSDLQTQKHKQKQRKNSVTKGRKLAEETTTTKNDVQRSEDAEKGGWETVGPRRKRSGQNTSNRPIPIRGCKADSSGLSIAKQLCWLFVSGLSSDTTTENIVGYMNDNGKPHSICEKIKTKNEHLYSSFKLGVPLEEQESIMSATFWPMGVSVNKFLNLRRPAFRRIRD